MTCCPLPPLREDLPSIVRHEAGTGRISDVEFVKTGR